MGYNSPDLATLLESHASSVLFCSPHQNNNN
jgi:hypothetical protein